MTRYSHSRLQTYRSCPRKYKFQYIDRIRDEEEGVEAFMGSRVHEALEKLYRHLAKSHSLSLEDVLNYYEASWERNWHDQVKIVNTDFEPGHYRETGRKCIRDYWRRYEPFDQAVVVGIERKVSVELDKERAIALGGIIDRLDRKADGVYEIHDYKTNSMLPAQTDADADPQLALYQLAVEAMWPDDVRDVTLVWHYLAFDTEIRSRRNPEALEKLRADTLVLIEKVEADREFEAAESALCDWCGYAALCPRRKHEKAVSELPPEQFSSDDGVRLVNEYVDLAVRKADLLSELDERIEIAKKALISYAEASGVDVIVGSDHRVSVKRVRGVTVPKKGSPERERLDQAVRELGKWDEVSCLDASALGKVVSEDRWDVGARLALGGFLTECESYRITKSRLRSGRGLE